MHRKIGLAIVALLALAALLVVVLYGQNSNPGPIDGATDASLADVSTVDAPRRSLTVYLDIPYASSKQKEAMEDLAAAFMLRPNNDIDIQLKFYDRKNVKVDWIEFLRNPGTGENIDVFTWHAGYQMRQLAAEGLLHDLNELWESSGLNTSMQSSRRALTVKGKKVGVPYAAYYWGIYYNREVFEPPEGDEPWNLEKLITECKRLRKTTTPFAIGTAFPWPAAVWFDYLDLRINGWDFHRRLMDGEVSYEEENVQKVFDRWGELIEAGCFLDNHDKYWWSETVPRLVEGKAAMYLFGQALLGELPGYEQEREDKYGLLRFPDIEQGENNIAVASLATFHIHQNVANVNDAIEFLKFAAEPHQQATINKTLGQVSPRKDVWPDDPFLKKIAEIIWQADALAQYYDRDTDPEFAKLAMKAFRDFMLRPRRLDSILEQLDAERRQVFAVEE